MTIKTERLLVVAHLPRHLRALLASVEEFENTAGLRAAAGIRDLLLSASADYLTKLETAKQPDPWQFGFAIIQRTDNVLMGMAGFRAPPDEDGIVEIAYGIAPQYQGQGYATEAANALIEFATNDSRVKTLHAHTLAEPNASTRVLEKCGFARDGESTDEGIVVWRWTKPLSP